MLDMQGNKVELGDEVIYAVSAKWKSCGAAQRNYRVISQHVDGRMTVVCRKMMYNGRSYQWQRTFKLDPTRLLIVKKGEQL